MRHIRFLVTVTACAVLTIAVHATAALYHHFVLRDGLLKRMWFGRRWPEPRQVSAERENDRSHAT